MNKEPILYLECYSGISGDMTVGALLDLGVQEENLKRELEKLGIGGYTIQVTQKKINGLRGCDFSVHLEHEKEDKEISLEESANRHRSHTHSHRHYSEIQKLLEESKLSPEVKNLSLKIFEVTAKAEAKVHGVPLKEVGFHETGAIDSIVDVVAVAFCIQELGVKRVAISELWEGRGNTECQHGNIPVPVPAVTEIVKANRIPMRITHSQGEMVTPTGASIVAALRTEDIPSQVIIKGIGIGTGKKEFEHPNILRAFLLEEA